jgi:branched-chain amino acid transport system ATP-binding protein
MLAVGRALALNPRVLLLDEPTEGLAPIIVDELLTALRKIVREEGNAAIIVEQSPRKILPLCDEAIILDRGQIAYQGKSVDLAEDAATLSTLLGVAERNPAKAHG